MILRGYSYDYRNILFLGTGNSIYIAKELQQLIPEEGLIPFMVHRVAGKVKNYFYSDSKCTGCGICEKVCPFQKITMEDNKPLWQHNVDCYMGYACLNFCPTKAIQIYSKIYMKSYTLERGGYLHPYTTADNIAGQK